MAAAVANPVRNLPENLIARSYSPQIPHRPANETLRQETLDVLGINGETMAPDPMLNSMCKTITRLMDVPIAGVSIVQDKTLRMRAAEGLPLDFSCARDCAFCSWTLLPKRPEMVVVEDTLEDPRFATLETVKGPAGLRFYAGAPLLASNGTRLGAVCIFDTKPRKMCAEEYNLLSNFSEIASRRLEERDFKRMKTTENESLKRTEAEVTQPLLLCDLTGSRYWDMLYGNEPFTALTGVAVNGSDADAAETGFWRAFKPAGSESKTAVQEGVEDAIRAGKDFEITVLRKHGGDSRAFRMHFKSARHMNLGNLASTISVPNIVAAAELGETSQGYYFATVQPVEQLTLQRLESAVQEHHVQKTFVNAKLAAKLGYGAHDGMRDVTMGVLCANTPEGLVYRARWKRRSICVKVQEVKKSECERHEAFGTTPAPLEAALTLNLNHPNVLSTYKVVIEDSPPTPEIPEGMALVWMVREWCGRGTLSEALLRGWLRAKDGSPDMAGVLHAAVEVASAVAFLHTQDIVHGDICPDSVQLQENKAEKSSQQNGHSGSHSNFRDTITKLTEFGISTRVSGSAAVSAMRLGNAAHAAPELLDKGTMSKASDIYALGMLLVELYSGQAVWPSLNFSQLHRRVVAAKEKPALPADAPHAYKELVESCLANDAAQRPTSEQVVAALGNMQEGLANGSLFAPPPAAANPVAKLFKMDSKRRNSGDQGSRPQAKAAEGAKPAGKLVESSGKSLFRRLGLKLGG